MNSRYFPEANRQFTKPLKMTDEKCGSLWVRNDGEESISCWQLTWEERLQALLFGRIWLGVLSGRSQPPVRFWCMLTPFQATWDYLRNGPSAISQRNREEVL